MAKQMALDFSESSAQRMRRAKVASEDTAQPGLFTSWSPNIDVHLHSPAEAVATIAGPEPEKAHKWLSGLVGSVRVIKPRRVAFEATKLDRLLWLRPPAQVTLDAACLAVARALWGQKLGYKPLKVTREGNRLHASSPRWPAGMAVRDAPWTSISALVQAKIQLNVDPSAETLFERRLKDSGAVIASASLAGSAVRLDATRPEILEKLALPGLAYDGEPRSGRYKLPLLTSDVLLTQPLIHVPDDLRKRISEASRAPNALKPTAPFPWTLYTFQSTDAGRASKILTTTGGVLLAGDMGSGKALANSQRVLTPDGAVPASRVRPGDLLIGSDGQPTTVLDVYPQGVRPTFTVHFSDGSCAEVDAEHLWQVTVSTRETKVLTTTDIQGLLHEGKTITIPTLTGPVTYRGNHQTEDTWHELGSRKGALTRYLPLALKTNPENRLMFLRGLAGLPPEDNSNELALPASPSPIVTYGLQRLVGELGGVITSEKDTDIAVLPPTENTSGPRRVERRIERIVINSAQECVCFRVEAQDSLFCLPGGILTHNTTVSLALVHEHDLWPLLVVAPLSAFSTWDRQLNEMGKRTFLATGPARKCWEEIESGEYEAVVIAFDRLAAFGELIERMPFRCAIADEIQRVRSPNSRRSRALRSLATSIPYRIGLSGTPLVNGLSDLLPIGSWIAPGEWKPRAGEKDLADTYPGDSTEAVADHLGALMVRRRMEDVPTTLPKRNDHRVYVQLTREQRRALSDLEEEARRAKEEGAFDDPSSRMHAFSRLQQMRKIINNPASAGVPGPNPKVKATIDLAQDFLAMGRKGVIFTADRATFTQIGEHLDALGIGWVGIWGSTPPQERIANEKKFHTDPETKIVLCTIQAGSESWSASPTATWLITTSYVYAPAALDQMSARVYRMNSDPAGPDIEIMYVHAKGSEPTLDDRMLEILSMKRHLFSQVVDRSAFNDDTNVHYSMADLVYLLTGERDESAAALEADEAAAIQRDVEKKEHAKRTLYKRSNPEMVADDQSQSLTFEQWQEMDSEDLFEDEADEGEDEAFFD